MKNSSDRSEIFKELKALLQKFASGKLEAHKKYIGLAAEQEKPGYHLYGKREISLFGKDPQKTYFAGIIMQKNYVSFYFMPVYSHPGNFNSIRPELKKYLKGKSCFNITDLTEESIEEIETLLKKGIQLYTKEDWI